MNVPVGIIAVLLVRALVIDPPHAKAKGLISIDYIGLTLLAIGLGALQVMLDKGQEDDWFASNFIITCAAISAVCPLMYRCMASAAKRSDRRFALDRQ